ncbi:ferrous iron transport protein A [Lachnospira multipara]|uniref:Ferrous iron transport protein A n=2 Tax=Lachnospira TaxID=28050 RepID=A0A1H5SDL6_9FIRM|nr:FeoA family protein [Lachnospira multipara]SEF48585.1 ferrous iron transport protein A [Lachnospira multipara]
MSMPLSMLEEGNNGTIVRVGGLEETRQFLEKLGFVVGADVEVVSKMSGNVIVNVKGSRVAIGKDMANKIMI